MDTIKFPTALAAVLVSGTFWSGFQEVLSKAAIPTTPREFGAALASLVLVLVPVAVQWLFKRVLSPPTSQEAIDLFNQALAAAQAEHAKRVEAGDTSTPHVQPSFPPVDGADPTSLQIRPY